MRTKTFQTHSRLGDYKYKKRYHNPYFLNNKISLPWKKIIIVAGIPILILCIAIFILSHPIFDIKEARITGLKNTPKEYLESQIISHLQSKQFIFFRNSNQFLFDSEKLKKQLLNEFSATSINIKKSGTTIDISIQERTSNLLWITGGHTYVVDLEGIIVREFSDSISNEPLPLFFDKNNIKVDVGSSVLTRDEINSIFDFHKRIGELGVVFTKTNVNRVAGKWMSLSTLDGYEIYFDATGDIQDQVSNLKTLIEQRLIDTTNIEYIDLRFGEQVYYK